MADLRRGRDAALRAAEALLRGTGGRAVMLRLPAPATGVAEQEQIGLVAPKFNDVELSPVVFRRSQPQAKADGTARWELLVSAISVAAIVDATGSESASAVFATAFGVMVGETLMEIEAVSSSDMDGAPYVFRLRLRAPQPRSV